LTRFLGVILDPYELFVALLPIRAKDLAEDEQTELIGLAVLKKSPRASSRQPRVGTTSFMLTQGS
jgi:hypothetical protein